MPLMNTMGTGLLRGSAVCARRNRAGDTLESRDSVRAAVPQMPSKLKSFRNGEPRSVRRFSAERYGQPDERSGTNSLRQNRRETVPDRAGTAGAAGVGRSADRIEA